MTVFVPEITFVAPKAPPHFPFWLLIGSINVLDRNKRNKLKLHQLRGRWTIDGCGFDMACLVAEALANGSLINGHVRGT